MTTYLFPGQGSQIKGMGGELFSHFAEYTAKADDILGYSIENLCLEDPQQQLNQTQFTQPALYMVNALTYFKKLQETNKKPDFLAGHSLGEYNALLAAEVFDFETGLKLVKKRGELMSQALTGGMMAIVGLDVTDINTVIERAVLQDVTIANYNSHKQVVLSGRKDEIDRARTIFEQAGASLVVPLKVSGAFHSPLMNSAKNEFEIFLNEYQFFSPIIPVIANYSAKAYLSADIHKNLAHQIASPVRWTETIDYLLGQNETDFEEIGPGMVLTGLLRRIKNGQ